MLHTVNKLLVALGVHEFESDDLCALRESMPGLEVCCCASEADVSLLLGRKHPDALCLFAPWSSARVSAVLHQIKALDGRRIPLFLCGPATDLPMDANGALEIHRVNAPVPTVQMLRQALGARGPEPAMPTLTAPADHNAVARFVGGIAHDFNNLLATIMGEVQLAASRTQDERVIKHLDRANEGCFRMASEIRKLLVFQEGAGEKRGMVEVGQVLRDARRFVPEMLGRQVEVETVECPEPVWIEATVSGLRQIVINIVAYAGQHMPPECGIRLGLRKQAQGDLPLAGDAQSSGQGMAIIEVATSTAAPTQGSQYEPAFTRPSRDAGVSLAIVWKLVQDFGGMVSVLQDTTGGAAFRVSLPLAHPSTVSGAEVLQALAGDDTLIIASTDRSAAESLARDVRLLGYRVSMAASTLTLAQALHDLQGAPACVLLDADCEALDPADAHRAIRGIAPRIPILLAAPELSSLCRSPFSNDGLTCLVHKPLDLKEVLTTVRALLAAPAFSRTLAIARK